MGWRWRSLWVVALLVCGLPTAASFVQAQELNRVLLGPAEPLAGGSRATLQLYCVNNGTSVTQESFGPILAARLICGSRKINTLLILTNNPNGFTVSIGGGEMTNVAYQLDLPPDLSGLVKLRVKGFNDLTLLVRPAVSLAGAGPPPLLMDVTNAATAETVVPSAGTTRSAQMVDYLRTNLVDHLSLYEPIYFILGDPIAEFQLSVKYQVFSFENTVNPYANLADHFYFAYTQTSYWKLLVQDPSFYDNSYKPSLFFYYTNVNFMAEQPFRLDLQTGSEHESNGKGGSTERSYYTVYAQPTATFELPEDLYLSLQPRFYAYYLVGGNNQDIADYHGYADLNAALTWQQPGNPEKIQFSTKYTLGDHFANPGWKFDLRFNLAVVPWLDRFNPTIMLQYFTGYGQTLIQYNQKSVAFRAGLCLYY